jgi:hypothetical protein
VWTRRLSIVASGAAGDARGDVPSPKLHPVTKGCRGVAFAAILSGIEALLNPMPVQNAEGQSP